MKQNKQRKGFFDNCQRRLEQGAEEYGDKSFYDTSQSLVNDIDEELMDIANWSSILATTCEKPEALAFLSNLASWSSMMSKRLNEEMSKGTFDERCLREGMSADDLVSTASSFLERSLKKNR